MKITPKSTVRKFLDGGAVATEAEAAPVEAAPEQEVPAEGGQDPIMQLAQIFAQGLQSQDCNMLAQGAQMFLQLIQGGQQAPQGQPVFKKGGKIVGRINR